MKKRILLFTLAAGMGGLVLMSNSHGPAGSGYSCTGAETDNGNPAGCSATGSSCHGTAATTGITVAIQLDSVGVPTTHYKGGMTYTVKLTGTNTTTNTLPKFGFQIASMLGTTATATPTNEGTWSTTLPSGTHEVMASSSGGNFLLNIVEQASSQFATTLSGATGATYVETFTWTAPSTGTGTISFWAAVNAVNADALANAGDLWNTNHVTINEWVHTAGVNEISNEFTVSAFPNPTVNTLTINVNNAGNYSVEVYDINGRIVVTENMEVSNSAKSLNTSNWIPGMYQVVISKDGVYKVVSVAKQ